MILQNLFFNKNDRATRFVYFASESAPAAPEEDLTLELLTAAQTRASELFDNTHGNSPSQKWRNCYPDIIQEFPALSTLLTVEDLIKGGLGAFAQIKKYLESRHKPRNEGLNKKPNLPPGRKIIPQKSTQQLIAEAKKVMVGANGGKPWEELIKKSPPSRF